MPRDEELIAAPALACGALRLVPLIRVHAQSFTRHAGLGEAELAAILVAPAAGRAYVVALPDAGDASSWSERLASEPALLAAIRDRLAAATDA